MEDVFSKTVKPNKIFLRNLKNDFEYQNEAILIKTLLREPGANLILFIIDANQGLMEHSASTDAIVYVVEGEIEFSVSNQNYNLTEGNVLQLTAEIPHSFIAVERSKMLLLIFN